MEKNNFKKLNTIAITYMPQKVYSVEFASQSIND